MTSLSHDRFCDEVVAQTSLLREVVGGADLSVTVPTTPDWNLAQLLRHVGGNLRAFAATAATALQSRFGSADPARWREPRKMYEVTATGGASPPPLRFFDRGTWQQSVELGP